MRRTISVLIVEDNSIDAHITDAILKNADDRIETTFCTNGETALNYLTNNTSNLPDFVLLDINMPVMDGKEFLQKKSSYNEIHDVPVIMLSSSGLQSEKNECLNLGAVSFIEKPLSMQIMQEDEKLRSILQE